MLLNRKPNEGLFGNEVQFTDDAGVASVGDCSEMKITMLGEHLMQTANTNEVKRKTSEKFPSKHPRRENYYFLTTFTAPTLSLARNWYEHLDEECEGRNNFLFPFSRAFETKSNIKTSDNTRPQWKTEHDSEKSEVSGWHKLCPALLSTRKKKMRDKRTAIDWSFQSERFKAAAVKVD